MPIDTVKIKSPALTHEMVKKIEALHGSKRKISVTTEHGEIEQQFTMASLKGSFDAQISMKVDNVERRYDGNRQIKAECDPYLVVECSGHKVMTGHNLYGGSNDFAASMRWLVDYISQAIGEPLPSADDWLVRRLDFAEVFQLLSKEMIFQWFSDLKLGDTYRKRPVLRYGRTGIHVGGHSTCLKFYHKGTEYFEHDSRRLRKTLDGQALAELQRMADTLLRVEIGIKAQKLDYDFGRPPTVNQITEEYLHKVYNKEISSFLREGTNVHSPVRRHESVKARLSDCYENRLARNLFRTWMMLAALGEESVKAEMGQGTYYEHIRYLREAGCSWNGTDIFKAESSVPEDFSPTLHDKRRLQGELPDIAEKLNRFR